MKVDEYGSWLGLPSTKEILTVLGTVRKLHSEEEVDKLKNLIIGETDFGKLTNNSISLLMGFRKSLAKLTSPIMHNLHIRKFNKGE